MVVDLTGSDMRERFGDSKLNRSGDTRAARFMMDERTGGGRRGHYTIPNAIRRFA